MPRLNKIFVVIDPTTDHQSALNNAAWMASQDSSVALHVYAAIYSTQDSSDLDALRRVELARHRAWVETLLQDLRAAGNEVTVEVEWNSDWRDAIAPAALRAEADLVVKSASAHSTTGRRLLKTADWALLRHCHCPVYLIKREHVDTGARVLLAVDVKRKDEIHSRLNQRITEYGRLITQLVPDSQPYAVNAYANVDHFVSPAELAAEAGVPESHAHTVEGPPEKLIPRVADHVGASIVVIGTAGRDGIKAALAGNTAEMVMDSLATNLLVVPAH